MRPRVAILAGHYGPGTGASWQGRDEWTLARRDALMLYAELLRDEILVPPALEPFEETAKLTKLGSIRQAARWAMTLPAHAIVELHYNSAASQDMKIAGNELVVGNKGVYADTLDRALAALPNRHRDIKVRPELELFKCLPYHPVVIVEPAFIWEPQVETGEWSAQVAVALKHGLYKYFAEWAEEGGYD